MLNFVSDSAQVGKLRYIASCNVLAVNDDLLKDFCFVMKITNCRSSCTDKVPRPPQFKFNDLFNKNLPYLVYFLKVFCRLKTNVVEVNIVAIEKWCH